MIFKRDILSQEELNNLSLHKYSSCGRSFLDPIFQPFWNGIVQNLPVWISPNLITILGLLTNILSSLILICYSPDGVKEAPSWTFIFCAVGIFIYQTLDAIDGKQARRTGTDSPLGELFDHGCDSLSTVFVSLGVCIALELGRLTWWMFILCFTSIALFYIAHWQTYVSGTLRFGRMDVTEVQVVVIIIHLISAFFGSSIWSIEVPTINIQLKLIPILLGIILASFTCYSHFTIIFTEGNGKNKLNPKAAETSRFAPFVPLALILIPAFVISKKSFTSLYETHPCLYILAFGIVASKITNKLVVAYMTKSNMKYLDRVFIGPGMLFLNQYFDFFIYEYTVLWACLVYSLIDLLVYSVLVCQQICSHLHISLFKITPQVTYKIEANHIPYVPLETKSLNGDSSETLNLTSNMVPESSLNSFMEENTSSINETKTEKDII